MARLVMCSRPGRRIFEAILPSSLETEVEVGMACVAGIQGRAEVCRVRAIGKETAAEIAAEDAEDTENQKRPAMIFRIATAEDLEREKRNNALAEDAMRLFSKEVAGAPQVVRVVTAWFSLDRSRLILLYLANRRFPARKAGAVLAKRYRTSVRVFQIGLRDAAAILGGLGTCGRQLCCATWLQGFQPVSVRMAKAQDISLTPASVDGTCARLKCCLRYEYEQPQDTDGTEDTGQPEDTDTDGTDTGAEPQATAPDGTDTGAAPQAAAPDGTDTGTAPQAAAPDGTDTGAAPQAVAPDGTDTGAAPQAAAPDGTDTGAAPQAAAPDGTDAGAEPQATGEATGEAAAGKEPAP